MRNFRLGSIYSVDQLLFIFERSYPDTEHSKDVDRAAFFGIHLAVEMVHEHYPSRH